MSAKPFKPTDQQAIVIAHGGSAFVEACPGAGKTRAIVERARRMMSGRASGRGIAFLSFTIAAVSELEDRLRRDGLIDTPAFPHFIGTFDSFLWQLLIAPFGIDGCAEQPRLIPDRDSRDIQPFAGGAGSKARLLRSDDGRADRGEAYTRRLPWQQQGP